ncbi:hypothetical protein [Natronorubrum tibetense]|uniref:Uncharacterized protein n=1 Tax=Natronorubrum tibetense GA33 TaxID=1114856 RepID=L9W0K7_9EURY|nr:hypothetical protein [Natronorubrum tibetense]ELY42846.1 hypothetical protein C496_05917 [Natronorubrum tibetense GA33]
MTRFITDLRLQVVETASTIPTYYILFFFAPIMKSWQEMDSIINEATGWMLFLTFLCGVVPMVVITIINGVRYQFDVGSVNQIDIILVVAYVFGVLLMLVSGVTDSTGAEILQEHIVLFTGLTITSAATVLLTFVLLGRLSHTTIQIFTSDTWER